MVMATLLTMKILPNLFLAKAILKCFALPLCLWTGLAQPAERAQAGQQRTVRKSAGVLVGSATKRIEPEYPAQARQRGISGKVVVEVTIDQNGQVVSANAVSGPEVLREAAVRAARRWRFTPTYLSGVPVGVTGEISFNFEFDGDLVASKGDPPRGRTVSANSPMLLLSDRQRRGLNKLLDIATPLDVTVISLDRASLAVARATIRSSQLDHTSDSSDPATPTRHTYAIKAEVILANRTDLKLIAAGLEFTNTSTNEVFYVYPNGLSVGGKRQTRFQIPLMLLNSEPYHLSIQAVGALFSDSSIWGAFPYPPRLRDSSWDPRVVVDSRPELLSAIRPTYTDEARRNRVKGAVRLELEIGADGAVKHVEILNALPDGLTDEAVRIARHLTFRPAIKSGDPVPCLINLDIEFKGG
jgi:TonB family protein